MMQAGDAWNDVLETVKANDAEHERLLSQARTNSTQLAQVRKQLQSTLADCRALESQLVKLNEENSSLRANVDGFDARLEEAVREERQNGAELREQARFHEQRFFAGIKDREGAEAKVVEAEKRLKVAERRVKDAEEEAEDWRSSFLASEARETELKSRLDNEWQAKVRTALAADTPAFVKQFQIPASAFVAETRPADDSSSS